MTNDKKVIYDASKGFWQGVPARDLTLEEWDEVSKENQKTILALGIYKLSNDKLVYKEPVVKGES